MIGSDPSAMEEIVNDPYLIVDFVEDMGGASFPPFVVVVVVVMCVCGMHLAGMVCICHLSPKVWTVVQTGL